jgi:hypothetical protein
MFWRFGRQFFEIRARTVPENAKRSSQHRTCDRGFGSSNNVMSWSAVWWNGQRSYFQWIPKERRSSAFFTLKQLCVNVISPNQYYPGLDCQSPDIQKIDFTDESAVEISAKMQIWSDSPEFPTMTVDNDDSPIQKRKSLNVGYFDASFLSKIFHFLWVTLGLLIVTCFSLATVAFSYKIGCCVGRDGNSEYFWRLSRLLTLKFDMGHRAASLILFVWPMLRYITISVAKIQWESIKHAR